MGATQGRDGEGVTGMEFTTDEVRVYLTQIADVLDAAHVDALCDALDAANAKLAAVLDLVPEYAYIDGDDRLVVKHDDMCAAARGDS